MTQLRQPALLSPLFCADCTSNHSFPCAFSTVLRHLSPFAGDISHYSFPCQTRIPPVQYNQTKRKRLPESRKSCGNTDKELKSYEKRNFPFWQVFERHGHAEHRCIYCMGLPHSAVHRKGLVPERTAQLDGLTDAELPAAHSHRRSGRLYGCKGTRPRHCLHRRYRLHLRLGLHHADGCDGDGPAGRLGHQAV